MSKKSSPRSRNTSGLGGNSWSASGRIRTACVGNNMSDNAWKSNKRRNANCREWEQEKLCKEKECQAAAKSQSPFGSHMPVQDEHDDKLDYYCDEQEDDPTQQMWRHLVADMPINKQLEQARQSTITRELQEAAMLEGPSQEVTPSEEEALLTEDPRHTGLNQVIKGLQGLPDSALSQISQHIDKIRRRTPSLASPIKSPGPPPGLPGSTPQNSNMAQQILQATTILGQLPSGDRPVTVPPDEVETRMATDILEAQLRVPGTPVRKKEL